MLDRTTCRACLWPSRVADEGFSIRARGYEKDTEDIDVWQHDPLTEEVIGCAIEVHRLLGPGLLESTYEQCLARELSLQGVDFQLQTPLPVEYKGIQLNCGYRVDMLVEQEVIVEIKAVKEITGIHQAQVLTYLRLAGLRTGLLMNFHVHRLKDGIQRFRI